MILDNFPKVLWINLEQSVDRRKYMEELFNSRGINHTRISAISGLDKINPELNAFCKMNLGLKPVENACTCSHLKALKYFVEKMTDDKIIIFEDDVSFEFLEYIPFNWSELEKKFPENYTVIQLAIFTKQTITNDLVKFDRKKPYYCTTAYLITRTAAKKILQHYFSKSSKKFDLSNKYFPVADFVMYILPNTYSIPIFTYLGVDSTIQPAYLDIHRASKQQQLDLWKKID